MQLHGITLPSGDGAVPPDLGQRLHLQPGDHCPICRQRAAMQSPVSDFQSHAGIGPGLTAPRELALLAA